MNREDADRSYPEDFADDTGTGARAHARVWGPRCRPFLTTPCFGSWGWTGKGPGTEFVEVQWSLIRVWEEG